MKIQVKLIARVENEDNKILLAAPVTSKNSGVKKITQRKIVKPVTNHQRLRPVYEDPRIQKTNDKASKDMDEDENLLKRSMKETYHSALQQTLTNS